MRTAISTLHLFDSTAKADPRSGSVLMETVIVLPILLLVVGGLFILGDMAHGRLHLTSIDRAAAWGADNRFAEPAFKDWFAFIPRTTSLRIERVKAELVKDDSKGTKGEKTAKGAMLHGNQWLGFYSGYGHAKVAVPFWYGSANAHNVLFGGSEGDRFKDEYRLFTYSEMDVEGSKDKKAGDYREFGRSFVVHRGLMPGGTNAFNRVAEAKNLAWLTIVGDSWCGAEASAGMNGRPAGRNFHRHPYAILVGE